MKITEKKPGERVTEFRFDNGAWASIYADGTDYGSYEYQSDEDDEETYVEGGLWFNGKEVVDYDGCFDLPEEIKVGLVDMGYSIDQL